MAMIVVFPDPARSCFYRIKEGTRQEYVAVGSTGRIVRWAYIDEPQQVWLLLPHDFRDGQVRYRVMTKQNGEYMNVHNGGEVVRWAYLNEERQFFRPYVVRSDNWCNIQEFTRSEVLDVNSWGDLCRWSSNGGDNQCFQFLALDESAKPALRPRQYEPDQIPFPPQLTAIDDVPDQTTTPYVIGEVVLPSTLVDDSMYSSKISQMEACPYYILAREQFWKRTDPAGFYYSHNSTTQLTKTFQVVVGLSETESTTMENTVGMVLSGSMEVAFRRGVVTIGGEVSASLSLTQYQSATWMGASSKTEEHIFSQPSALVYWALVDCFTLMRGDRYIVNKWQISRMDVNHSSSYPPPPAGSWASQR